MTTLAHPPPRSRRRPRHGPRPGPVLRPATGHDRAALAVFLTGLSPQSSLQRFFTGAFRVTDAALDTLLCRSVTGAAGRAFVAVEGGRVVAHAMWSTLDPAAGRAEVAFVTAAERRGRGLASALTRLALADAACRGYREVEARVLADNPAAQRVLGRLLPGATRTCEHGEVEYVAPLAAPLLGGRAALGRRAVTPTAPGSGS